jgi:hypothetical protein
MSGFRSGSVLMCLVSECWHHVHVGCNSDVSEILITSISTLKKQDAQKVNLCNSTKPGSIKRIKIREKKGKPLHF